MILIHDTYFDIETIREKVVGGGILPVCRNSEGKLMMLLGKERYISHWRGSLKWSGFEGGKKNDEEIEKIAAREFVEESLGVVALSEDITNSTVEKVFNHLKNSLYSIFFF